MNGGAYSALWRGYDRLNAETDYSAWADFITALFCRYAKIPVTSVLDLGCGTGSMTLELRRRGYDLTGLDLSCEMLSEARDKAEKEGLDDILWLCQDMRSFELYGTVSAAVCCLDGLNHLTGVGDLKRCLSTVRLYLEPGGLFVFDVNTPKKFREFYGNRDYILEDEDVVCCWQNDYDPRRRVCDFYLSVFERRADGAWNRTDTVQRERCYSRKQLVRTLEETGFTVAGFFTDFQFGDGGEDAQRWYVAARAGS